VRNETQYLKPDSRHFSDLADDDMAFTRVITATVLPGDVERSPNHLNRLDPKIQTASEPWQVRKLPIRHPLQAPLPLASQADPPHGAPTFVLDRNLRLLLHGETGTPAAVACRSHASLSHAL